MEEQQRPRLQAPAPNGKAASPSQQSQIKSGKKGRPSRRCGVFQPAAIGRPPDRPGGARPSHATSHDSGAHQPYGSRCCCSGSMDRCCCTAHPACKPAGLVTRRARLSGIIRRSQIDLVVVVPGTTPQHTGRRRLLPVFAFPSGPLPEGKSEIRAKFPSGFAGCKRKRLPGRERGSPFRKANPQCLPPGRKKKKKKKKKGRSPPSARRHPPPPPGNRRGCSDRMARRRGGRTTIERRDC